MCFSITILYANAPFRIFYEIDYGGRSIKLLNLLVVHQPLSYLDISGDAHGYHFRPHKFCIRDKVIDGSYALFASVSGIF